MTFKPEQTAAALTEAHEALAPVQLSVFADGPGTREEAYDVQARVLAKLGANGGFKTARPEPGRANIMAPIPARFIRPSPARYTAREMRLVGVELEIAFLVRRNLPAPGVADYDATLREAVAVVPVIEMVDSRIADRDAASDLAKLADNQSGFGLVAGPPRETLDGVNLKNPAVTFEINGAQTGPTAGQVPGPVDAFEVLKDFLATVGNHCGGVRPGQYITTGALTGLHWGEHGDHVRGHIEGLGSVAVTIAE